MQVKLALPKGQLQDRTAALLADVGFAVEPYHKGSRSYRPRCESCPGLFVKVFHEKDIAIQVAIGNYDLGICRLDWVEELLAKYHSEAVVKVRDLGYGNRGLYAAVAESWGGGTVEALRDSSGSLRIVSEYPNIAESFALKSRLKRFQILPVWGAAGVYPPDSAEVAILAESSADALREQGLMPVAAIMEGGACLIANRNSLARMDLGRLIDALSRATVADVAAEERRTGSPGPGAGRGDVDGAVVSLALPDGHQQPHTVEFLKRAGVRIEGYAQGRPTSRPRVDMDGVAVKVVRPQDMPLQVANGSFDLAITGRDWLRDHRFRFPSSPVAEVLNLGFGRVRIVAVVTQDMPVSSIEDLGKLERETALRVASEYVNIADKYAHDNHLTPCKIIPTWGASEAFLPEDADVLIENTETGSTIARNKLKIIDTLFESSACLIGNTEALERPDKKRKASELVRALRRGTEARAVS